MEAEKRLYARISDDLRDGIRNGEYPPGARLPSRPEIMTAYGVSDAVAKQAIGVLVAEGLAQARPGSGTYVIERPPVRKLTRAWYGRRGLGSPFRASMAEQGHRGAWTYQSERVQAPADVRERLALPEPTEAPDTLRTEYVFTTDDRPAMLSTSYEPLDLTEGTDVVIPEEGPHAGRGVVDQMSTIGVVIDRWDETVGARNGTAEECRALGIPLGSVVMTVTWTYEAAGRTVEVAFITLPADLFVLGYAGQVPHDGAG